MCRTVTILFHPQVDITALWVTVIHQEFLQHALPSVLHRVRQNPICFQPFCWIGYDYSKWLGLPFNIQTITYAIIEHAFSVKCLVQMFTMKSWVINQIGLYPSNINWLIITSKYWNYHLMVKFHEDAYWHNTFHILHLILRVNVAK